MKIPRLSAACLAILLALIGSAKGQEQTYEKYNFAITPPAGWVTDYEAQLRPGLVATFEKPDKSATFSITADSNGYAPAVLDDSFIREYNLEAEDAGRGKLLSGTFVNAHGLKCYERKGTITKGGDNISTFLQVMPANGTVYSLMAARKDGDAGELPEIRQAIASFHFLKQPATPRPVEKKSAAFKAGYFIGQNAAIVAPVSLVLIVVMLIVIVKIARGGSRRRR